MFLQRHIEPAKIYHVCLKSGAEWRWAGFFAKIRDDGALIILDNSEHVIAAYAGGEWKSVSFSLVPMVTINADGAAAICDHLDEFKRDNPGHIRAGEEKPMSDREMADAFAEVMPV